MFKTRRLYALAAIALVVAPQAVFAGHFTVRYRYTAPHYYLPWTPVVAGPAVVPHSVVVPQAGVVTQSIVGPVYQSAAVVPQYVTVPQFAPITSLQFATVTGFPAPAPDAQSGPASPADILARRGRSGTPAAPVAGAGGGGGSPAPGAPGAANPGCPCETETTFDRHMSATKSLLCQLEERYETAGLTKGSCTANRGSVPGAGPGGSAPPPGLPAIVDFRAALREEIDREISRGVLDASDFSAAGTKIRAITPDQLRNLRARGQKLAAITRLILTHVQPTSLDKIERWTRFADKVLELLAGQPQLQSVPSAPAGGVAPDRFHQIITDDIGLTLNPN